MGNESVRIRLARQEDLDEVYQLVQKTIRACYPAYYTPSVVEAFCHYHSPESIGADIAAGRVHVLEDEGRMVGTATLEKGGYIGRVYVLPTEQGRGYGSRLMNEMEALAAQEGPIATLDSSVPGRDVYLHRGYAVARSEVWEIESFGSLPADRLLYEVMEKPLR